MSRETAAGQRLKTLKRYNNKGNRPPSTSKVYGLCTRGAKPSFENVWTYFFDEFNLVKVGDITDCRLFPQACQAL